MTFEQLGLTGPILKALQRQGYTVPTPIQTGAIGPVLAGRDVLGLAQTGTGKTCAFAAPILQRLAGVPIRKPRPVRALVVTPTRELAIQIQESFCAYGENLPLRSTVIFGGVGQNPQVDALRRGSDILVATPGRLLDLHGQGLLDLGKVEILVLDEADRMLDMGFIHDVRRILQIVPEKKQTLFFSATMPPEITQLVESLLHDPVHIAVDPVSSPVERIEQTLYYVDKANKLKLLCHLVDQLGVHNALVFSRTKHGANRIAEGLCRQGIPAAAIHGNKSQTARQAALADFKAGKIRVLVATDIAARGIDIEELSHVFNYDLPEVPETYVHRIGRTGRAGHEGTAVAFCETAEKDNLRGIEKLIGKPIPVVEVHPFPMEHPPETRPAARAAKARHGRTEPAAPARQESAARKRPARPAQTPKAAPEPAPARAAAPKAPKAADPVRKVEKSADPVRVRTKPARAPYDEKFSTLHFDDSKIEERAKPDPLAGDQIMDATARLLSAHPRRFVTKTYTVANPYVFSNNAMTEEPPRPPKYTPRNPDKPVGGVSAHRSAPIKQPPEKAAKAAKAALPAQEDAPRRARRGHRGGKGHRQTPSES
ncbi:MAG: DEAD/DEAH box helicase [Oscillospiraceae bacterium]|nr:DEAD/DEAH box helicase [Oscillospiraceae bacterium]